MDSEVKVSVLCLAYNHEKYIRKTLEGFVSQKTDFKFEVIVNDDASTDNTAAIIREFEKKYPDIIKPIYQTENQFSKKIKITDTYFLPRAKGKYIAFCEGDDFWCDETKLQKQFNIMESDSSLSMCVHKVQCIYADSRKSEKVIPAPNYGLSGTHRLSGKEYCGLIFNINGTYPFQTSSYFMKREVLQSDICLFFKQKMFGDKSMMRSAFFLGEVYYFDEIMSCWRMSSSEESWHSKAKSQPIEKQIAHYMTEIQMNIEFDKMTNNVYHDQIVACAYGIFMALSASFKSKNVRQYLLEYSKKEKFNFGYSLKFSLKYILMRYFPFVFDLLSK